MPETEGRARSGDQHLSIHDGETGRDHGACGRCHQTPAARRDALPDRFTLRSAVRLRYCFGAAPLELFTAFSGKVRQGLVRRLSVPHHGDEWALSSRCPVSATHRERVVRRSRDCCGSSSESDSEPLATLWTTPDQTKPWGVSGDDHLDPDDHIRFTEWSSRAVPRPLSPPRAHPGTPTRHCSRCSPRHSLR